VINKNKNKKRSKNENLRNSLKTNDKMDNSTDYNTSPPSSEQESCIDRDGREILDGFLYTPG
jgi:hypothetical protein